MTTYKTVNEVKRALDKFLRSQGDSHDGAHYVRPDGTRGPIVRYVCQNFSMDFSVDRAVTGGWRVANAWLWYDGDVVPAHAIFALRIWEGSPI